MYFYGIFRLYIADQKALFNGLLSPPEVGGELVFYHKCLTPPKVVLIASWVSLMAYSRFFSMVNTKYTAEDRSGENSAFLRAWVLSPTNKVCTTAAESTSDLEPHRQLFHQPQFLMQKAKNSVNSTWWTWARPSTVTRHPSQCVDGDSGEKIWAILNFL